jgi:cation transport ATPase
MRKIGQAAVLVMGGIVGCLEVWANLEKRNFGIATLYFIGVAAAFSLAWWLFKKGKKEIDE